MTGQKIAYRRVSSLGQNTARQLPDMTFDREFEDKLSGKDRNRPGLDECLKYARQGDEVFVHSLDRLGRNLADLMALIREFTSKGVTVRFVKEGLIFTGEDNPFQTLQLQLLGAFSEFERALIKERQREGIAQAKAEGKILGRKAKLTPIQMEEARTRLAAGESKASIAEALGVSRTTLWTVLKG